MKRILARLKPAWRWIARVCTPSDAAWTGATWGLIGFWVFIVLSFLLHDVLPDFAVGKVAGLAAMVGALVLAGLGALLALMVLNLLRPGYRLALALALPLTVMTLINVWDNKGAAIATALLIAGVSLIAGAGTALVRRGRTGRPYGSVVFLGLGLAAIATLVVGMARTPKEPNPTLANYQLSGETLDLPDPGRPGPYKVRYMTYGGGADRHRPEYAGRATWRSRPVDGSKLDKEWDGPVGWLRTLYWGFDPKRFPVQGRVWAPEGPGPFPLVLIVHGNHAMEDFSDSGYAYLGELLASQGFILVSVDENFLNSSLSDMVDPINSRPSKENDARGWMLLEHLVQWRGWNADPAHPLYGKVDMDRIGLMGHSRGGEAVAVAAAFNKLDHYPDDATQAFNYGFNIGAVVAIAPVDGQYRPRDRPTPLKDVNYFVIHGSLDGDVTSFMGSSQFSRDQLSGEVPAFKAQLYVKDANHGQFNTGWGRDDIGLPWPVLDKRSILDPEAQRQIARVYFSAFLQTTLMGREGYRPLFADPRRGVAWLPKGYLAADYADGTTVWAATFEEDGNPGSATSPGAKITGSNLSVWREADVSLKVRPLDSQVAQLAWDDRVHKATASYAIDLGLAANVAKPGAALVFSAADAGISSLPDGFKPPKSKAKPPKAGPLDWTIVLEDVNGAEARVPLSRDQVLYPQIKGQTRRFPEIDDGKMAEVVMRRYRLPLADFAAANPRLDLARLKTVRFDFDRSRRGAIALDNVGVAPGAWIGAEVRPSSRLTP
jgi:dienelactone hydrolase